MKKEIPDKLFPEAPLVTESAEPMIDGQEPEHVPGEAEDSRIPKYKALFAELNAEVKQLRNRALEAERKATSHSRESRVLRIYCEMIASQTASLQLGFFKNEADVDKFFTHLAGMAKVAEAKAKENKF